jgi:hypothetical protein
MKNKKTTVPGYLLIGAGVLTVAAAIMGVGDLQTAMAGLVAAIGGAGFINAQDGGH